MSDTVRFNLIVLGIVLALTWGGLAMASIGGWIITLGADSDWLRPFRMFGWIISIVLVWISMCNYKFSLIHRRQKS